MSREKTDSFCYDLSLSKKDEISSAVKPEECELCPKCLGQLKMNDVRKTVPTLRSCELNVSEVSALCKITKVPLLK